jgi:(1->4)-alpha-D-glucan 1-alpha-D-glucosylmutase
MAKGVEDTAFYRFFRLASANEVGGDPGLWSTSVEEFHALAAAAQRRWPSRMLSSSTHDTKRSEDVRARIALLSEMPDRWRDEVFAWRDLAAAAGRPPTVDANTEYLLYQTLVGAWPIDAHRLWTYLEKAIREQKVHTSWTDPDEAYESALRGFVEMLLESEEFTARVDGFVATLAPAWEISALAQTLLKLTAPGIPDIYQGTEIWDLSLVDPDNRRPVDYAIRRRLLGRARTATSGDAMADIDSGLAKIWLIHRTLAVRARRPELFGAEASYRAIEVSGARAENVVAFARGDEAVVVAPRLVTQVGWPDPDWGDTVIDLPGGRWRDELSEEAFEGGTVALSALLREFPVALLLPEAL